MIFSYTLIRDFQNCPEAVREIQINKRFKKTFTGDMLAGTDVHAVAEKRIKAREPAPVVEPFVASFERAGTVEAEVPLAVDHWLNPVSFWGGSGIGHQTEPLIRGKFDVLVTAGDKTAYADWKTGTPRENNELQFRIGALLLFQNRPAITAVRGFNIWLKTGRIGQAYTYTRETASVQWAPLLKQMREIEQRDPAAPWEKQDGPLCAYCPVKTCQHYRGG